MSDRKFQNPITISVRMEREVHAVCKKLKINFTEEINNRIVQVIPQKLQNKNLAVVSREDIDALIQVQQKQLEHDAEVIELLKAAEARRLEHIQLKKQESEVQQGIEKEKETHSKKIDERRQLLDLFHSLCSDSHLFSEEEALSYEHRFVNTDEEELYPIHAELRGLVDQRLPSLNGAGERIRDILDADENPGELLEKAVSWIAMDARKRRSW